MKLKSICLVSMALLAGTFAACNDNDVENFDNQVYIKASTMTSTVLLKNTVSDTEGSFQISMARPEAQDITITLKADPSLVAIYNAAYYDTAEALPENYYTVETSQTTILAGAVVSDDVTVSFKNLTELDREKVYVLPVTVDQASIGVLKSSGTMYYVLKGAALINTVPDITKNLVYVTWNNPDVVNNMNKLTAEALIRVSKFDKMLTSIMGIEGRFLLRIGDSGIPQNQLQVATGKGNVTDESLAIPTNEWTHIAMTYDADAKSVTIYINGKNMLETTLDYGTVNWGQTMTDEGNGFWIGHSYSRDRWLEGNISEVRIWNKVLTSAEINAKDHFYQVEPDADGLVSYWKFDEGAGTTIHDYSGNENNATAVESLTWTAVELPAK
ncbi:DUF1735 and LamG domain-containing protein [uncultured Bacteroides sp.]|uniref:DUF1735 and LamG domain-containing protein n=1 Tax=uncultured Bacteroides sp. TaxID=162156 RepID=UPI0025D35B35|nr:DUF1735 and LamG domain-containing protein [uncultured Bacteroides sp.]